VIGGLLTPLGLLQAPVEYGKPQGIRCGLAGIKQRLLRALQSAGVCLHEIEWAKLVVPEDSPMSGSFYRHADPVIPTYWLTDEVVPSIAHAIMRFRGRDLWTSSYASELAAERSSMASPPTDRSDVPFWRSASAC
jgi:hypothetical protein